MRGDLMDNDTWVRELQNRLDLAFSDPTVLVEAFTHRSFLNENRGYSGEHNERLEFLGDALLGLCVKAHLHSSLHEPEGVMSTMCSMLLNNQSLAAVAKSLGIPPYLRVGRSEQENSDRAQNRLAANLLEALIAAVYVDRGHETAMKFVAEWILPELLHQANDEVLVNPQGELQKLARQRYGEDPQHRVLAIFGAGHNRRFTVGLFVGNKQLGTGEGWSIKAARKKAAQEALEQHFDVAPPSSRSGHQDEAMFFASPPTRAAVSGEAARIIKAAIFLEGSATFKALDQSVQLKIATELAKDAQP